VTKDVEIIELDDINYIDSPGFNDPNKERTDIQIFTHLTDCLSEILKTDGIASIIQCVMIPESGRIKSSTF
jgi:hypothetical protein